MRVLVCGGRDFIDNRFVFDELDAAHAWRPFSLLVTGVDPDKPSGVDGFADAWAKKRGIDRVLCPANWTGRGKPGGPFRNGLMLSLVQPELVIAFPGNIGTGNMIRQAKAAGVEVVRVEV